MIVFYEQERNVDVRTKVIEKVKMYEAAMKSTPSSRVKENDCLFEVIDRKLAQTHSLRAENHTKRCKIPFR